MAIDIYASASLTIEFSVTDQASGDPFDLTGAVFYVAAKNQSTKETAQAATEAVDPTSGVFSATFTSGTFASFLGNNHLIARVTKGDDVRTVATETVVVTEF